MTTMTISIDAQKRAERASRKAARGKMALIWALRFTIPLLLIVAWQLAADKGLIDVFFFSKPSAVAESFWDMASNGTLWEASAATLLNTVYGFLVGGIFGIGAGILLAHFPTLNAVVDPMLAALNALPRVALAPMFILWFGIGPLSKVFLAASLVFFIVLINTHAGVKQADEELVRMAKVMGGTPRQRFFKVVLPSAVPSIFAGLRLGFVYSLLGVIVGEMLAAKTGLGQLVSLYAGTYRTAGVLATLIALAVIGLLLNELTNRIESWLLRWQRE